ncbi:MAG: tungstate ABC transporter substrate-binding protein WtpA [Bacteroidales bacterium]|nr:tungstate ABC transporter substrate-binding protein WtpA [Bacteroidales bacterium]
MKKFTQKKIWIILLAVSFLLSCSSEGEKEKLIIFHAGSLSVPFKQMKKAFEKENPGVEIFLESAGSVQSARKITDLKKPCDIMASADYKIIDQLLIPGYAQWNIQFATNEMAIVYHGASRYAGEINADNWYKILLREDVIFGRSDPDSDPCGYRAILTTQLAEKFYNTPGLTNHILSKNQEYIRPKEVDLLALLESNSIDYIFLYRSVAEQHGLKYVVLPDSINLKNPDLNEFYKNATVDIIGKEPGSTITQTGKAMVYGITILTDAPNPKSARLFLEFVLAKDKGAKIMEENGQPSILKTDEQSRKNIPDNLLKYFSD